MATEVSYESFEIAAGIKIGNVGQPIYSSTLNSKRTVNFSIEHLYQQDLDLSIGKKKSSDISSLVSTKCTFGPAQSCNFRPV